jgi:serine phosphatase RsbU (regulator of sigma subunit)
LLRRVDLREVRHGQEDSHTDGITEAANPEQEEFGRERLVEVCQEHVGESPKDLATSIHVAVDAFVEGVPYHDDRTLVILRRLRG